MVVVRPTPDGNCRDVLPRVPRKSESPTPPPAGPAAPQPEHPLPAHPALPHHLRGAATAAAAHRPGQRLPRCVVRELELSKVLVEIEDDLERVPAPPERRRVVLLLERRSRVADARHLLLRARRGDNALQHLVRREREAELRRRPHHSRGSALEEGLDPLLPHYRRGAVSQAVVRALALARFHLQPRLDHVARRRQVRGRHTRDGASRQELHHAELLGRRLAEKARLEVAVRGEVDGREGHVAEEARRGALVEALETEVLNDPDRGPLRGAVDRLGHLSLDLQADLDDLERVGEHL